MKPLVTLLFSIALTSTGQLILKKALIAIGPIERIGLKFFQMFINPQLLLGITFAVLGWAVYMMALSKSELSYAYPIWSLTYVVVPILSLLIFRESISLFKMGGLSFIFLGVFLVALSAR